MTPRHRDNYDRAQAAWERKQTREQIHELATSHPGKVAKVKASQMLDLRDEPTHIHRISAETARLESGFARRVKVTYAAIGNAANVRNHPEVDVGGPLDAGSIQASDVHPSSRTTHVELIRDGRTHTEQYENANDYIQTHWDPQWMSRERITPEDTRGDGDE